MANYPTSLDSLTNPNPGDQTTSVTVPHAEQHATANDILEALEAKLGIGAGAPPATAAVLRRTATGASGWGLVQGGDLGTGTARAVTLTVAASNASALSKAMADYVCDGTADQVEINAALTALPAGGGVVQLTEGTFIIAAGIATAKAGSVLRGAGVQATTVSVVSAGGAAVNVSLALLNHVNCTVADLTINGNKANNAAQTSMTGVTLNQNYGRLLNVQVSASAGAGIAVAASGFGSRLENCIVDSSAGFAYFIAPSTAVACELVNCVTWSSASHGFYVAGTVTILTGCEAYSSAAVGFYIDSGATDVQLANCRAANGASSGFQILGVATLVGCHAQNNAIHGVVTNHANARAILSGCVISNNATHGIYLNGGLGHVVSGCRVSFNGGFGIAADVATENVIVGNRIYQNSFATHAASSNIWIGTVNNYIVGNIVRRGPSGNRPTYGVEITAGTNNYIGHNDLFESGIISEINDPTASNYTRRVVKPQLNYANASDINTTISSANVWTPHTPNQTFRVNSPTSVIEIATRGIIQIGASMIAGHVIAAGIEIDSSGSPQAAQVFPLGGALIHVNNGMSNGLDGTSPVFLTNLVAGDHTVRTVVRATATGSARSLASAQEVVTIQVVEYQR